jgi:putative heme-binding domain-containing protein
MFASHCAACHGLDGKGSERGPNLVSRPEVEKLSASELESIISSGVPGTGMPPFRQLGRPAISTLITYVKTLQGKGARIPLPGDPASGRSIFFGAGQCSTCHMVAGQGGFLGPDLTAYGQTHTAEQIQAAITNPAARESQKSAITVTTSAGARYEGVLRNEDNFSLQMQSPDGAFHFFRKADLKAMDRSQESLMPSDYRSRLSAVELKDICSFLLSLADNAPDRNHAEAKE